MSKEKSTKKIGIVSCRASGCSSMQDTIAIEKPLEILLDNGLRYKTFRTPGNDKALLYGFCLSEGFIGSSEDIKSIEFEHDENMDKAKIQISSVKEKSIQVKSSPGFSIDMNTLQHCRKVLESNQTLFRKTGSTHAAALFNDQANLLSIAEDLGRHNALDKALGMALIENNIKHCRIAFLSSRGSLEMLRKICNVGVDIVGCCSGSTSMAIELAESCNVALAGFVRDGRCNIYTFPERFGM